MADYTPVGTHSLLVGKGSNPANFPVDVAALAGSINTAIDPLDAAAARVIRTVKTADSFNTANNATLVPDADLVANLAAGWWSVTGTLYALSSSASSNGFKCGLSGVSGWYRNSLLGIAVGATANPGSATFGVTDNGSVAMGTPAGTQVVGLYRATVRVDTSSTVALQWCKQAASAYQIVLGQGSEMSFSWLRGL